MYYHVIVELGAKYHKDVWDQLEIKSDISSLEDIKLRFTEPYQLGELNRPSFIGDRFA